VTIRWADRAQSSHTSAALCEEVGSGWAVEDVCWTLRSAGYDVQLTTYEGRHEPPPADIGLEMYAELLGL
jgi:hypothetical protein